MLRYAGRVGTGFKERDLEHLGRELAARSRDSSPFTGTQPPRGARFVEPELVAEIEFAQWTREHILRHSSYKGLRDDKPAITVVREQEHQLGPPAPPGIRPRMVRRQMEVRRRMGMGPRMGVMSWTSVR